MDGKISFIFSDFVVQGVGKFEFKLWINRLVTFIVDETGGKGWNEFVANIPLVAS